MYIQWSNFSPLYTDCPQSLQDGHKALILGELQCKAFRESIQLQISLGLPSYDFAPLAKQFTVTQHPFSCTGRDVTSQGSSARESRPLLQRRSVCHRSRASAAAGPGPGRGAATRASRAAASAAGSRSADSARSAPRSRPVLCAPPLSLKLSARRTQSCKTRRCPLKLDDCRTPQ